MGYGLSCLVVLTFRETRDYVKFVYLARRLSSGFISNKLSMVASSSTVLHVASVRLCLSLFF
jgi:hypothetical protein